MAIVAQERSASTQMLSIDAIRMDERCQPRVQMDMVLIADYAEAMKAGDEFPAVTVFRDGGTYWLADGFHRLAAAKEAGKAHVVCDVIPGTIRDAILHAVGANALHGKRRTNDDKRRAVKTLLNDDEWRRWSNVQVSNQCAVSESLVRAIRDESESSSRFERNDERRKSFDRHGNVTERNVSNYNHDNRAEARAKVEYMLSDPEMRGWSNKAIADRCNVSEGLVWNMRRQLDQQEADAGIPPYEEVDPTDPATFLEPMQPAPAPLVKPGEAYTTGGTTWHGPEPSSSPHVSHNSGENEWYTPVQYIEAAREVMGDIDLDPASSDIANQTVNATTYYTKDDNGLVKPWYGRVWMNPPYAQPLIQFFAEKVADEFKEENISEAIVLVNNATETKAWQYMARVATAVCFPRGRIRYLDATGKPAKTPLQGQSFLYFGPNRDRFISVFEEFGVAR